MKKEYIIVAAIIIIIIITHGITQNYTRSLFDDIIKDLTKLEESILNNSESKEELLTDAQKVKEKFDIKYDLLAYYIEHDELEKIETQFVAINAGIKIEELEDMIIELEKCIFIMEHVRDKDSMKLVNIF